MIIYRPIGPLTTGRSGLMSAFAAVAMTALLGTTWQVSDESAAAPDIPAATAGNAYPVATGRNRP